MKVKFNSDRIIAVSAIMISLMTLFIFLYQTNVVEEQSRLSVRPRLTFNKNITRSTTLRDSSSSTEVNLSLILRNNGLGPAIVESSSIDYRGKSYEIGSFFQEVFPELANYGYFQMITELTEGEAIPASEATEIFSYRYNEKDQELIDQYLGISKSFDLPFDVLIVYSSMYEEKWKVRSNTQGHPEKID